MTTPDLHHLAAPGTEIAVRVTPRASRNAVVVEEGGAIRIYITCVPEDGKATAEAARLLARAVGVAKTRLVLLRGATARDKLFRVAG
ncbi:MAG: DUF167 domain-containing protein [Paracoccaceae bacterium]|nr:DUF167 domain-containing protein [Paracoccaceae bacterium]